MRRAYAAVFAGTWLAYAGLYLCRKNFSILMPALSAEGLFDKDSLALLVFAYSAAYAFGQFLNGAIADAWGAKRVVFAGMLVSAACNFRMGLASPTLAVFLSLQIANGLAQSAGWPGLLKITAEWFSAVRRGIVMAWWSTNLVIGGLAGTLLATFCITGWPASLLPSWGWRLGAIGPALALIALAAAFYFLVPAPPPAGPRPAERAAGAWRAILTSPALLSIALCYFCLKLMRYSFLFWLPLYMVERLRYSQAEAGYSSSVYELVGFLGVPLAGYFSDHVFRGRRFPAGCLLMFALAGACLAFPAASAAGGVANLAAIGVVGMLTFGPDTLLAGAATQEAAGPEAAASAGGFVNGVGSIGQLLSPLVVSATVRWFGWDGLFSGFVGLAVLGGLALAFRWSSEVIPERVPATGD